MNIHKSQLFWGSLGTWVLTHPHVKRSVDVAVKKQVQNLMFNSQGFLSAIRNGVCLRMNQNLN